MKGIIDKLLSELQARVKEQHLEITLTERAKEFIANSAYDPVYGARPLKRYLQREVETKLARELIAGKVGINQEIMIDLGDNGLVLTHP